MSLANKRAAGFTLVELLTVIGIIAVLVAILFPVLSTARAKARQARCMSNMQQIGQAIEVYVQDNHGFLPTWSITNCKVPPSGWDAPSDPEHYVDGVTTWDISIMSYLRNEDLLVCPDNPNPNARGSRSYSIAQYTQHPRNIGGTIYALGGFRDEIPAPQATVLVFEKGNNEPGAWGDCLGQNVYQSHDDPLQPDQMWHHGGKNFLFCDYHVKWFKAGVGPFAHEGTPDHSEAWGSEPGVCVDWGRPDDTNASGFEGDWPMP